MKRTYVIAVVAIVVIAAIGAVMLSSQKPAETKAVAEYKTASYTDAWTYGDNDELVFNGWGVATHYGKLYVKVILEGTSNWTQTIKKDDSSIEQEVEESGVAKIYSIFGTLIDTKEFRAYEKVKDVGMDAGTQKGNGATWYAVNWEDNNSVAKLEYYEYSFSIVGVYDYVRMVSDGQIVTDEYYVS